MDEEDDNILRVLCLEDKIGEKTFRDRLSSKDYEEFKRKSKLSTIRIDYFNYNIEVKNKKCQIKFYEVCPHRTFSWVFPGLLRTGDIFLFFMILLTENLLKE